MYFQYGQEETEYLSGKDEKLGAVIALILGAGLSILGIVVFPNGILGLGSIDWIGTGSFFAAFILLRKYKWNPILTMCLCGAAGLGLHLLAGTVG